MLLATIWSARSSHAAAPGEIAGDTDVVATTVVQARPDMLGDGFVSGWQTAWGAAELGPARLEGYGELGWPAGVDQPWAPALYVLTADGDAGPLDWTVGRQRLDLPAWGRLFDGGRARWSASDTLSFEGWVGATGRDGAVPVARLAGTVAAGPWLAVAGAWGEAGEAPALHPDLRVRWATEGFDAQTLAAVAVGSERTFVERARAELAVRPAAGVRTVVHAEHREADRPSILGELAPHGVDEAGVGTGWSDVRRSQLWIGLVAATWLADEAGSGDREGSVRAEVSWRPTCMPQSWCVRPSWRGVTGSGGVYQSFGTVTGVPLPGPVTVDVHGVVAPYRKPQLPWSTAVVAGASAEVHGGQGTWAVGLGGELLVDGAVADPRGWLSLRVGR